MTLLITGGASGIGAEAARLAAARGYKVAINYRSREAEAKKVVADITGEGGHAVALPADVAREADIGPLFDAAAKALGPITHLVNSAGISGSSRVEDFDAAVLTRLFAINTVGLMLCCREAARRMSTKRGGKGGVIVNISGRLPMVAAIDVPRYARDDSVFVTGTVRRRRLGVSSASCRPARVP